MFPNLKKLPYVEDTLWASAVHSLWSPELYALGIHLMLAAWAPFIFLMAGLTAVGTLLGKASPGPAPARPCLVQWLQAHWSALLSPSVVDCPAKGGQPVPTHW